MASLNNVAKQGGGDHSNINVFTYDYLLSKLVNEEGGKLKSCQRSLCVLLLSIIMIPMSVIRVPSHQLIRSA